MPLTLPWYSSTPGDPNGLTNQFVQFQMFEQDRKAGRTSDKQRVMNELDEIGTLVNDWAQCLEVFGGTAPRGVTVRWDLNFRDELIKDYLLGLDGEMFPSLSLTDVTKVSVHLRGKSSEQDIIRIDFNNEVCESIECIITGGDPHLANRIRSMLEALTRIA
jgi:hypothetical protein